MEDPNSNNIQQSNDPRNSSTPMLNNLLNVHHLLNSVEAALQQVAQESAQREAMEKQGIQSVPDGISNIDDQNSEPFKKKRRGGGRKRKGDDAAVTIDGHTITATGDLTQDGVLEVMQVSNTTPKKNCLLCGAPIALRNYCWKCYKRKQRAATKGDISPLNPGEQGQVLSQNAPLSPMNMNMNTAQSLMAPFTFTAPKFDEPIQEPTKRVRKIRGISDVQEADRKLGAMQEKLLEETEKISENKQEAQILMAEFIKRKYKENSLWEDPELLLHIGKAFCDSMRLVPRNAPFKKPLITWVLRLGGEVIRLNELEKLTGIPLSTLQQARKMADEENIMMEQNFQFSNDPNVNDSNGNDPNANYSNANYSNTSYSNENDKEKEKKNQSTQNSQISQMVEAMEEGEVEGDANAVASLVQVAEASSHEQLLQGLPADLLVHMPQEHHSNPGMAGNSSGV